MYSNFISGHLSLLKFFYLYHVLDILGAIQLVLCLWLSRYVLSVRLVIVDCLSGGSSSRVIVSLFRLLLSTGWFQ